MNKINKNIIQFSPIRSGSTLVYNILRELFVNVNKTHNIKFNNSTNYVVTIRHPYNSIISSIIRLNKDLNKENIIKHINEYKKNGGIDITSIKKQKNICLLQYENFINNFSYITNKLQSHFEISIDPETKIRLYEKYNINEVYNYTKKYKDFSEYDNITHIHGNHISKYKGLTNYNDILSNEKMSLLKDDKILNKILNKFEYFT